MTWQNFIADLFTYGILVYSFVLILFYLFIAIYSMGEIRKYLRKNSFADFRILAASDQLPGMSILAPAYNESANIVENVRSMLSIHYNALELIIINDGSKDDSLKRLIDTYDLYKTNIFVNEQIATKKIRGIYKSNNSVFHKLLVVDKENGGKADALNVGINIAQYGYIVCIDVDCVLEQDALLRMIKPFLEETKVRVIASGGVIRIANDCKIENGKLIKINLAKKLIPRVQTLEYIRAFLLGRMAWSRLNGLLLISGAFGAFDKDIVIKCGGYNRKTVGEDMELIVRMRRYMEENKFPYKVNFIPDPLCWTEVPGNYKILGRQRNRWTRGTIETLWMHRKMFFNPQYGLLGTVSYPYWFFFEFLAPIIEFIGFVGFIIFSFFGITQWAIFFILLASILLFGFLYSVFAILIEVLTYNQYKGGRNIFRLVFAAFLEPFLFHPFIVWSAIKGNIDYLRKKHSWGEMTRQGLNASQRPVYIPAAAGTKSEPKEWASRLKERLQQGVREVALYNLLLLLSMLLVKVYELIRTSQQFGAPKYFFKTVSFGLVNDMSFILNIAIIPALIFILLFFISKRISRVFFIVFSLCLITAHAALAEYFLKTLVPLGADLLTYSLADIKQTVGAAGVSTMFIFSIMAMLAAVIALFVYIPKKLKLNNGLAYMFSGVFILATAGSIAAYTNTWKPGQEFSNNVSLNKSYYFYNSCYQWLSAGKPGNIVAQKIKPLANTAAFNYIDEIHYPFLHTIDTSVNVLAPFFNKKDTVPDIVFLVVEGLGRAFSNKDAYLGSFTPFLDSLSERSLYWNNFLSAGGRTFAMPPSIFGSLPYGKNGFLEMSDQMPAHFSLFNVLQKNGYTSNFFYGGNATFDNMDKFMKMNNTNIYDENSFPTGYKKMPAGSSGFSWGYGDEELLRRYNEVGTEIKAPACNVVLTLSTHSPFVINEQDKYLKLFEERMLALKFTDAQKEEHRHYKEQYASILYADDAIKNFINGYAGGADFGNTIFIITGDHRMPEIPMSTKIDRYHVPLIIYSPLLKRSQIFGSISSHLDITPSLLLFFKHQYNLKIPAVAAWVGEGLDTAYEFKNIHSYPLMQTKNDITEYLMNEYLLNGDDLYKISNNMNLDPVNNERQKVKMKAAFEMYKQRNNTFINSATLMPDSLIIK